MITSSSSRVTVPEETLINVLGNESVILSLKSERYFGLDEIGTRMWSVLTTAPSLQEAYEILLAEYDVEPEILRKDLEDLLQKLVDQGLVEIKNE
jgi:hypothetical protein